MKDSPMPDHENAIKLVLEALIDDNHGVIDSLDEIGAIGHRVVHGGENLHRQLLLLKK